MLSNFRNYILKASALVGIVTAFIYLAPSIESLDLDSKHEEFKAQNIKDARPSKETNKRTIASITTSATTKLKEELLNDQDQHDSSNINYESEYSQQAEPALGNLVNSRDNVNESQKDNKTKPTESETNLELGSNSSAPNSTITPSESSSKNEVSYGVASCGQNCLKDEDSTEISSEDATSFTSTSSSSYEEDLPVVSVDLGTGNYSENPTISLTSTTGGDIYYCISEGSCCDPSPSSGGSLYSSTINVGSGDGNFCLSFIGASSNGDFGESVSQTYTIDQSLPDMTSVVEVQYIQTTQESKITINSNNFGKDDFDFGLYNLSIDPSAQNCQQIEENFAHVTYGVDLNGDSSPDLYNLSSIFSTITSPLRADIMNYGTGGNYFVSILANRSLEGEVKRSCSTHKVILEDFDYLASVQSSTSAPAINAGGHMEYSGTFNSYGIFRETAAIGDSSIISGSSRYVLDDQNILESSKEEIIY